MLVNFWEKLARPSERHNKGCKAHVGLKQAAKPRLMVVTSVVPRGRLPFLGLWDSALKIPYSNKTDKHRLMRQYADVNLVSCASVARLASTGLNK